MLLMPIKPRMTSIQQNKVILTFQLMIWHTKIFFGKKYADIWISLLRNIFGRILLFNINFFQISIFDINEKPHYFSTT